MSGATKWISQNAEVLASKATKSFRKARDFENALALPDTTAINMHSVAGKFKSGRMKYKSHVRPAPSDYD